MGPPKNALPRLGAVEALALARSLAGGHGVSDERRARAAFVCRGRERMHTGDGEEHGPEEDDLETRQGQGDGWGGAAATRGSGGGGAGRREETDAAARGGSRKAEALARRHEDVRQSSAEKRNRSATGGE